MLRPSHFNEGSRFFHLNFEYNCFSYFKHLDWVMVCKALSKASQAYKTEIHCVVMMDTHVHVLFRISEPKEYFFTYDVLKKLSVSAEENLVEPIQSLAQYYNTYKYIYRNPLVAGLVERCEDYEFSTLHSLLGKSPQHIITYDSVGIIQNPMFVLKWLNSENQMFKYSQPKSDNQANSDLI